MAIYVECLAFAKISYSKKIRSAYPRFVAVPFPFLSLSQTTSLFCLPCLVDGGGTHQKRVVKSPPQIHSYKNFVRSPYPVQYTLLYLSLSHSRSPTIRVYFSPFFRPRVSLVRSENKSKSEATRTTSIQFSSFNFFFILCFMICIFLILYTHDRREREKRTPHKCNAL